MHMDEGMDTGPILLREELKIMKNETGGSLQDRLAQLAGPVIIRTLAQMTAGTITEYPQDHAAASYAPKIKRSMGLIDWSRDATQLSCLIRALDPRPGAYTILEDKEIKLFSPMVHNDYQPDPVPGQVRGNTKTGMMIATGKGILEIRDIQYPGKKRMPVQDFLRGFSIPPETILGRS
jgi:methionyl-tRNA formyltransferase